MRASGATFRRFQPRFHWRGGDGRHREPRPGDRQRSSTPSWARSGDPNESCRSERVVPIRTSRADPNESCRSDPIGRWVKIHRHAGGGKSVHASRPTATQPRSMVTGCARVGRFASPLRDRPSAGRELCTGSAVYGRRRRLEPGSRQVGAGDLTGPPDRAARATRPGRGQPLLGLARRRTGPNPSPPRA